MADSMLENGVVRYDDTQPPQQTGLSGDSMLENGVVRTGQPVPVKVTEPIPEQPGMIRRGLSAVGEAITGSERMTPEMVGKELVGRTDIHPQDKKKALALASALMFGNEEEQKGVVESVYPGAKVVQDDKGNDLVELPTGEKVPLNKPGFSFQDFYNLMGTLNIFTPAGKAPGLVGKGLAKKVATGVVAEGGTELARQKAMQAAGSEKDVDIADVGLAAGLGGMTTAAGPLIKGFREGRQAKKLGVLKEEAKGLEGAIREGREAAEATGVELFPAQTTLSPSAGRKQAALQMLDGSSLKAIESLKKQDAQIGQAVEDTLAYIAPSKTLDEAPEMVVKAAEKKLTSLKKARTAAAKPLYTKALKDKGLYTVPKTESLINDGLEAISPKSPLAAKLKKVQGYLAAEEGVEGVKLSQLDRAYKDLGDMIESAKRKGDSSLAMQLGEIKDTYIKEIEEITPDYKKAVKTWERMSKPIDKYLKSVPGKIAELDIQDQAKLDKIANDIFKPRTTDAQVKRIRGIIQKESPEAWVAITRRRMDDLLAKTEYDSPGKVYTALFNNKANKKQLYAALDTEQAKRLKFLETAAERAQKGRFGGTDTGFKIEDIKDIDTGAWAAIGGLVSSPFETFGDVLKGVSKEQRRMVLADAMFNTKWDPDWKALRKLNPNSNAAKSKMMSIINKAAKEIGKPTAQALRAQATGE
jgi:hypothetical protein